MPVQKEVLRPGDNACFPQTGKTVSCHYDLFLQDGKPLGSTRARGKPFEMSVGSGQVIRGFEEGVQQMSVGERAKLTVSPDLAFGTTGIPNAIPPNSTLIFDVELLDVK